MHDRTRSILISSCCATALAALATTAAQALGGPGDYTVYPAPIESPNHTTPLPPADGRTLVVAPADTTASPFGWHDLDGLPGPDTTTLEGNNVLVFSNETPPIPAPDCGAGLECTFPLDFTMPPAASSAAAQTNLFYWLNLFHDVTYHHGFDEVAGNFQLDNYDRGGIEGDRLSVRVRYDFNCASTVSVPPDGTSANLILSPCTLGGQARDTAFDSLAILHLVGHTLSMRLIGGPKNTSCSANLQSPDEGWSDWFGLLFTIEPGDAGTDERPFGTWTFGQAPDGPGVRTQPYSTDPAVNSWTYATIVGVTDRFAIGAVWAQALWEATWALIDAHGFDPDLANAAGGAGNQRMLSYAIAGMKLMPCGPSFLAARDGLIAAAEATNGGEDVCRLWQTFAGMGMGTDATSVSPGSTSVTNGFAVPEACSTAIFVDGFESADCSAWSLATHC